MLILMLMLECASGVFSSFFYWIISVNRSKAFAVLELLWSNANANIYANLR